MATIWHAGATGFFKKVGGGGGGHTVSNIGYRTDCDDDLIGSWFF